MLQVQFGNRKLPRTTMIFNMGPAESCPSAKMGLCKVPGKCYAKKAEKMYPATLPYRKRQEEYWANSTADKICADFDDVLSRKKKKPLLLRFNESGDFYTQDDIGKLDKVSNYLWENHGITTYGYTARRDLDFTNKSFLVKISGSDTGGNNGSTMVVLKGESVPDGFILCPGDCRVCTVCAKNTKEDVAFYIH